MFLKNLCYRSVWVTRGSLFRFRHPKDAQACTPPKVDKFLRTGTKNASRCSEIATLGSSITCINMVPFHDLWTDGGGTEKRPTCYQSHVTEFVHDNGSYFWDTTLEQAKSWSCLYIIREYMKRSIYVPLLKSKIRFSGDVIMIVDFGRALGISKVLDSRRRGVPTEAYK
jgi:hypothetical protein